MLCLRVLSVTRYCVSPGAVSPGAMSAGETMLNLANTPSEAPQVRLAKAGATRVLVVDDEPTLRRSMVRMLAASGMDAIPVEDGAAALALLERERVHVALVDLMM